MKVIDKVIEQITTDLGINCDPCLSLSRTEWALLRTLLLEYDTAFESGYDIGYEDAKDKAWQFYEP